MRERPEGTTGLPAVPHAAAIAVLSLFVALVSGCGSSGGTAPESKPPKEDFSRYVRENESTFDPSAFGTETWDSGRPAGVPAPSSEAPLPVPDVSPDTVPGFRVQVLITQEIDRANGLRDSLFRAMPGQWIYIVHHPPYYKVRIGNYSDRLSADGTLDRLRRDGLRDAWVVPDRIVLNPPPAPVPDDSSGEGTTVPPER